MLNLLNEMKEQHKWVALYHNERDHSAFFFGKILAVTENYLVAMSVGLDGAYDGVVLYETEDIFRIEFGSQYEDKILTLLDQPTFENCWLPMIDEHHIMESLLESVQKNQIFLSVELRNSGEDDITGMAVELRDGLLRLNHIDEYGNADGTSYVKLSDITQIFCNMEKQRLRQKSYLNKLKPQKTGDGSKSLKE